MTYKQLFFNSDEGLAFNETKKLLTFIFKRRLSEVFACIKSNPQILLMKSSLSLPGGQTLSLTPLQCALFCCDLEIAQYIEQSLIAFGKKEAVNEQINEYKTIEKQWISETFNFSEILVELSNDKLFERLVKYSSEKHKKNDYEYLRKTFPNFPEEELKKWLLLSKPYENFLDLFKTSKPHHPLAVIKIFMAALNVLTYLLSINYGVHPSHKDRETKWFWKKVVRHIQKFLPPYYLHMYCEDLPQMVESISLSGVMSLDDILKLKANRVTTSTENDNEEASVFEYDFDPINALYSNNDKRAIFPGRTYNNALQKGLLTSCVINVRSICENYSDVEAFFKKIITASEKFVYIIEHRNEFTFRAANEEAEPEKMDWNVLYDTSYHRR